MKKLSTSIMLLITCALTYAQTLDATKPTGTKPGPDTYLFDDKAGSYGEFCGYRLDGASVDDNGQSGVMFKVKAKNNLVINGFSATLSGTGGFVRVYKKVGSYIGHESFASSWQLIDSAYVIPSSGHTFTDVPVATYVPAGAEMSFYIVGRDDVGLRYRDGVTEGAVLTENEDLILYEGAGLGGSFGTVYRPRNFVGKIHYCKPSSFACDTSVTQFNDNNSNYGVFFNVVAKSKTITLENIFADLDGGFAKVSVYTKPGTYEGSETNPAAWTLVDSSYIAFPINNIPEAVSPGFSITVPANSMAGFHIVSDGDIFVNYINGSTFNDTIRNEPFIAITGGKGADNVFLDNGLSRKFNGTFSYCVDNTNIDENENDILSLYPNPTHDDITLNTGSAKIRQILIMDISGKIVMHIHPVSQSESTTIDVSPWPSGTYFIKVIAENGVSTKTFIKR